MFRVTFLGHQSWLLEAENARVLVDPLLEPGIGDGLTDWLLVYPPRGLSLEALGPVDAVLLTHEHPDHFHQPSLARLPRSTPVWASSLSSEAMREALRALGFAVHDFAPGGRFSVGDLEFFGLTPCGRTAQFELDVVPFVARDKRGDGSFFSTVDLSLHERQVREARKLLPAPCVWTVPANDMDLSCFHLDASPSGDQSADRARDWAQDLGRCVGAWGKPALTLVYGGGYTFPGALEPLNARAFNCEPEHAAAHLAKALPGWRCEGARVGQTAVFRAQRLERWESAPWVSVPPAAQWPSHAAQPGPTRWETPCAVTGRGHLEPGEREELERGLQELARFLNASALLPALYDLPPESFGERAPTVALRVLRDDGEPWTYQWNRTACAFERDEDPRDPREKYALGMECWAADLHALLALRCSPYYVLFGYARFWNFTRARLDLEMTLYLFLHPLRLPGEYARLYRAQREGLRL